VQFSKDRQKVFYTSSKKKKKDYAGSESHSPHLSKKRSHFGTEYRKAPPLQKGKEKSTGIRRVAGLA
jgi:hypothetical protein